MIVWCNRQSIHYKHSFILITSSINKFSLIKNLVQYSISHVILHLYMAFYSLVKLAWIQTISIILVILLVILFTVLLVCPYRNLQGKKKVNRNLLWNVNLNGSKAFTGRRFTSFSYTVGPINVTGKYSLLELTGAILWLY